jgi:hypothetical protein
VEKTSFVDALLVAWQDVFDILVPVGLLEDGASLESYRSNALRYSTVLSDPFNHFEI